ncbi:MAG: glycosyltransferase family 4 protein [Anaerolineales bacterium]
MRICIVPQVSGVGGMVSFKGRLVKGLQNRGIEITYDLNDKPYQAVLVIGGTRQILRLWRIKNEGIPIIQRLDGMNWLHRILLRQSNGGISLRHYLRAEYGNWILRFIRNHLATRLVYQSNFVQAWWNSVAGSIPTPYKIIYNGVDLNFYTPHGSHDRPQRSLRILLVEGSLLGGYEWGLQQAVLLTEGLQRSQSVLETYPEGVELMVVGKVSAQTIRYWQQHAQIAIVWQGMVAPDEIPRLDRSAHILYSADIHPACPNAVIEALACGLPVLAFDSGAMREIIQGDAGRVVAYGADPWRLEKPNMDNLIQGGIEIARNQPLFRGQARTRAEEQFDGERMITNYLEVFA